MIYNQEAALEVDQGDRLLKLFVGGLNYLSMEHDAKAYFETFGDVSSCSLIYDKPTGKSLGFGFVSMKDR